MLSRQKASYSEHRCANHRSHMLLTNKCLLIDPVPSLKRRINGARRQSNVNNKAPTLKLLFSTYLSWLTHKSPVRRQPAIQLIDSVRWFVGSDVFLSASFLFNLPIWKQLEIEDTSYSVESVGQGAYDATKRGFAIRLFVWWAKTRRRKMPFCKYTNCALGWSGVTTDVLFNGFYGVVSCNCKTRKLCSMILRRILRNWFGGIFYRIFCWNQEKISENGTKGEFCRKLQDVSAWLFKKMLRPVTTMVSATKVVKKASSSLECYNSLASGVHNKTLQCKIDHWVLTVLPSRAGLSDTMFLTEDLRLRYYLVCLPHLPQSRELDHEEICRYI